VPARVLLVEDNPDLLTMLALLLRMQGHEVLEAANGRLALQALQGSSTAPDLIVLDLQMPVMDGWALVEALPATALPGIDRMPRLVVTASDNTPGWASAVVRKPFAVEEFLAAVERLVTGRKDPPR
jgi:two-component system KDP operon response regulator KdpE